MPDFSSLIGPEAPPLPKGASAFSDLADMEAVGLSGYYHVLPAGTELPEGFGVVADGQGVVPGSPRLPSHHTLYPTEEMTLERFREMFLKELPWEYGGPLSKR